MKSSPERSTGQDPFTVTVFGGTGFLGRRVVSRLVDRNVVVRVATRHPQRARELFGDANIQPMTADIHDERSVAEALSGARGAVNAVSLYVEHGGATFHSVHVEAARRVAALARRNGVERLVHVSGLGVELPSTSPYIRSRGEGERAVRAEFPEAGIIRPAVMFGPDDAFLTVVIKLLRQLPAYPLFGRGRTRLQPAYVEDVAQAIATMLQRPEPPTPLLECAGPRIYSYRELLRIVAAAARVRTPVFPVPFTIWHAVARVAEFLPHPPVTRNQVELMEIDNVATPGTAGFDHLSIVPHSIEAILPAMIRPASD